MCYKLKLFSVLGQTSFFSLSLLLKCSLHFSSWFYQVFFGFNCLLYTLCSGFLGLCNVLVFSIEFKVFQFLCVLLQCLMYIVQITYACERYSDTWNYSSVTENCKINVKEKACKLKTMLRCFHSFFPPFTLQAHKKIQKQKTKQKVIIQQARN